jgi:hypothetical protein
MICVYVEFGVEGKCVTCFLRYDVRLICAVWCGDSFPTISNCLLKLRLQFGAIHWNRLRVFARGVFFNEFCGGSLSTACAERNSRKVRKQVPATPAGSWGLLGIPGDSWGVLGNPGVSWAFLGSPEPWGFIGLPRIPGAFFLTSSAAAL